jgi:hypothetical protein
VGAKVVGAAVNKAPSGERNAYYRPSKNGKALVAEGNHDGPRLVVTTGRSQEPPN